MATRFDRTRRAQQALLAIDRAREGRFPRARCSFYYGPPAPDTPLVHLVLQGGGTLGLAHLGFVYGLEHAGVRCVGLAGTSAGAIVALMMAAARGSNWSGRTAERLLPLLESMPTATFMDGPFASRRLVGFALAGTGRSATEFVLPAIACVRTVLQRYGLNRGYALESWLTDTLSREFGVSSQAQLLSLLMRIGKDLQGAPPCDLLHLTATAMPIGFKVVFPRHAHWFASRYEQLSPALWARASMSVPLFFEPLELDLDEQSWAHQITEWSGQFPSELLAHSRALRRLSFVDGGLLSNFPIDAFERLHHLEIPTVGVGLFAAPRERRPQPSGSARALFTHVGGILTAMRHLRDREGLARLSAHGTPGMAAVAFVDTGPHHWLNFNLGPDAMEDLFVRGLRSCAEFLDPEWQ